MSKKFVLSDNFITKYKRKKPPFGFNGLGELVYMRTYSRIKENGKNERWWETRGKLKGLRKRCMSVSSI